MKSDRTEIRESRSGREYVIPPGAGLGLLPDIAILIVNYRTKRYLGKLLDSFRNNETYEGAVKFYIGDNASGEDLSDIPEKFPNIPIMTFQFSHNGGFGAGNNMLATHVKEPLIFLVNPDVLWIEPVISKLVASSESTRSAIVGPKLRLGDGTPQPWDHGELTGFRACVARSIGASFWTNRNEAADAAWISGAAFMINADVFGNTGGFDERFFLYREEEDLCLRIRREGWRIRYEPSVSMIHIGAVVAGESKHAGASHDLFLKKHYPFIHGIGISSWLYKAYGYCQSKLEKQFGAEKSDDFE